MKDWGRKPAELIDEKPLNSVGITWKKTNNCWMSIKSLSMKNLLTKEATEEENQCFINKD